MKIREEIHALKIPFQVNTPQGNVPRFVYVYLILGDQICLIDSGIRGSEKIIFDYLNDIGRRPEDLSRLILTHSHPDHIGAAAAIKEETGCSVAAHIAEKKWIEDIALQARQRPVPGFFQLVGGPVVIDHILQDGQVLELGESLNMQVLHTPGHSAGSISLWLDKHKALFSADAIPLPGDLPIYEDHQSSVRSMQRLKAIPDIRILLASWDDPREDLAAYRSIDQGLLYLQRIYEAAERLAKDDPSVEPLELCRRILRTLGLPDALANPLVAKSFQASLEAVDGRDFGNRLD